MQKFCKNHPHKAATNICHSCGNYFCNDCLNKHNENYYCNDDNCYKKYIEEVGITNPQKIKKSSKIVSIVVSMIVITIISLIVKQFTSNLFKSSEVISGSAIDKQLLKIASEINESCPLMVDSGTRLDNTGYANKTIFYNYTMIKYTIDEIDLNYFGSKIKPFILNSIKTSPEMKYLREKKVTFVYNYKDRTGRHLISFRFSPKEYNE
ncbi:MAG TPA: hypothetical protein PK073_09830 [Ignavibacteriaceae bacterium]|jgi:hypothetical protein|nr:MAG: hypothetical protein BWY38_01299 [Ignavibacteria bacterium ADurb.Bin266]OQY75640.1 MAG: hypothetical protein B6D44_00965 [Ignavibacteriales bacterium UTCHB2]HQF43198.1 hypothetical protein [Ignavibacteriaceae bacterium]HQI40301.1 hypothetical protein [Ignavibacteriaceae bacterium]